MKNQVITLVIASILECTCVLGYTDKEKHELVENEIAAKIEGNSTASWVKEPEKSGTLEYAKQWHEYGTKVPLYTAYNKSELNFDVNYGVQEKKSVDHTMDFTVSGQYALNDLSVVQVYAQFPDPDRPGMFQSFTCSARYATYLSSSYVYNVFNFYGPMSFKAGERTFNNN